jgi:hypothetical protein
MDKERQGLLKEIVRQYRLIAIYDREIEKLDRLCPDGEKKKRSECKYLWFQRTTLKDN